jgi:dTMP kinase
MSRDPKAFFVVIEGLDGTGKSTVTRTISKLLNEADCLPGAVKLTFEPHDPSACGVFIRQVLMHRIKAPTRTLALAFAMNRADHCDRDIGPFLDQANHKERVVLCDRYYMSSLVYQSDESLPMERILDLNSAARVPDLTLFLNAPDRACYSRMKTRDQSRELFESNLGKTRKKYLQAIGLLRSRGEHIVEISAEGRMGEVVLRVLTALIDHSPEWLARCIHPRLIAEDTPEYFEETGIQASDFLTKVKGAWDVGPLEGADDLRQRLQSVRRTAEDVVRRMSYTELCNVFLDLLKSAGYATAGRLPWMDIDAIALVFTMPLGITQHGAVIFMGSSQRYDLILPNILANDKIETLRHMSDFLLILDANPSTLHSSYYERDQISLASGADNLPSIMVFGREHLAAELTRMAADTLEDEFLLTINASNGLSTVFRRFLASATANSQWALGTKRPLAVAH